MSFLAPWTALIAAAAAVPLLVLLYFLKLKRRELAISSTLLWKRAVQDLQVNAPFQRLRRNILLLLQLLALLAVLLALARPVWLSGGGPGRRYVLLIDRSASMNAVNADGRSRLDEAKRQAKVMVESLRGKFSWSLADRSDQAMVIAFDDHAKVLCNFTSDKRQLIGAIDAIAPADGGSSLAEAVTVARAFAQSPGEDANNRTAVEAAELVLLSDGKIRDLDEVVAGPDQVQFHCVGQQADNVAVVAMRARRSYEKPDQVAVFTSIANYAATSVQCDLQLSVDGNIRSIRPIEIPARMQEKGKTVPGEVSVSFSLTHPGSAVLEARVLKRDALASDNAAWSILPPPKKLHVLLVTADSPALRAALGACGLAGLDEMTPAEFDALDSAKPESLDAYDVVVLDGHAPAKLPRGRYLVFGAPPPDIGVKATPGDQQQVIVDWRQRHPALEYVDLSEVHIARHVRMELPRDGKVLAEFGGGSAMGVVHHRGSVFLLVGFNVMDTTWPFQPGLAIFCYNATRYLGMEVGQSQQASLPAGSALTVRGLPGAGPARLTGPHKLSVKLEADASGTYRYPKAARAGQYTLEIPGRPAAKFAVNVLDRDESDIEPQLQLTLSGREVQAEGELRRANQELWPLLVIIALALVCLEWFIYNSKVRI